MRIDRRSFARRTTLVAASALGWLGRPAVSRAAVGPVRVRIWCEGTCAKSVYPNDIDDALGGLPRPKQGPERFPRSPGRTRRGAFGRRARRH